MQDLRKRWSYGLFELWGDTSLRLVVSCLDLASQLLQSRVEGSVRITSPMLPRVLAPNSGAGYNRCVRVIARGTLIGFVKNGLLAEQAAVKAQLDAWYQIVHPAKWKSWPS